MKFDFNTILFNVLQGNTTVSLEAVIFYLTEAFASLQTVCKLIETSERLDCNQ